MSARPHLELQRLNADRLPGLPNGIAITATPGVNLVVGPNESGKSSLVRAVFHLLWPGDRVATPFEINARFRDQDGDLQAARIDNGPVAWTRDGVKSAAPAAPDGHLARCYRLGLLDLNRPASGNLERDLAAEVRRQMAGGFDLDAVRKGFKDRSRLVRQRQVEWTAARDEAAACAGQQRTLAREEQDLAGLADDLDAAERAVRQCDRLEAAAEHHGLLKRIADLQARVDDFPPGTDLVQAGDDGKFTNLVARMAAKARQIAELRTAIADGEQRLAATRVDGDLALAESWVRSAAEAVARSEEMARNLAAAESRREAAADQLPPELREAGEPVGGVEAMRGLARAHTAHFGPKTRGEEIDRLADLADLREPDSGAGESQSGSSAVVPVLAAVAIVAGGVALAVAADRIPLLVGGGVALLAGTVGLWTGVRQWAVAEGAARGASGLRTRLRAELAIRRDAVTQDIEAAGGERRRLHTAAGGTGDPGEPDFLHGLEPLLRWRDAMDSVAAAEGARDEAAATRDEVIAGTRSILADLGEETTADLPSLEAAVAHLRERTADARALAGQLNASRTALVTAESDLADAQAERDSLLARLAIKDPVLGDDAIAADIRARLSAYADWTTLHTEQQNARHDLGRVRATLAEVTPGDPDTDALLALPPAVLQDRRDEAAALAEGRDGIVARMADIRARVRAARSGDTWTNARAREADAAAALADAIATQRAAVLGHLLLDEVAEQHETGTRPPLLDAADEYLATFTGGRYRLRLAPDGDDSGFGVSDDADRRHPLAQLSDGTRAQVFLAARLAFLDSAEAGPALPLFLDEALTASDPVRFDAVARALGRNATAMGRQVFYLTSNPVDVAAWQRALRSAGLAEAGIIDLAAVRTERDAAGSDRLALPPLPEVPAPGSDDPETYGARLGVAPVDPWDAPARLDLFHLWRDDLPLVHELARVGVRQVGQWWRQGRRLVRSGMLDAQRAAQIDARVKVWETFVANWQVGRCRPLTRADLAASGALTPKMLTAAGELLAEVDGDPEAFAAGANEGRIKHLRRDTKSALQDYLEREGHMDSRPVLDESELTARALEATAPAVHAKMVSVDEVGVLVRSLAAAAD